MNGDVTARIDERHLSRLRTRVGRDQLRKRVAGVGTTGQQRERLGPVRHARVRLSRNRANAGTSPGHDRADGEPVRLNRDPELTRLGIARDDR